jgi:UDP-2-acetamido-2,6-beta-L-arabino-hexul-4-ose reductase
VIKVLITGGRGFLGRNLAARLRERGDCQVAIYSRGGGEQELERGCQESDLIFHLAGVNRPKGEGEFETENVGLTKRLCEMLQRNQRSTKIVFSSSVQAGMDNPYGISKVRAEALLMDYSATMKAPVAIYRLKNLFGKWCRPHYNSVTATFCHSIAHDEPIVVSDPNKEIELSYVEDVVDSFVAEIDEVESAADAGIRSYKICLGDLAGRIQAFHEMRSTFSIFDCADWFNRALFATYLSYVPREDREYKLTIRSDARGSLAEFIKGAQMGQVFVSRTKPGVTRGNHYHNGKTEKFFVVEGEGLIRIRPIEENVIDEYLVKGEDYQVVDIPPGMTHSISNVGNSEMVTLFWSSEVFDPDAPDTYYLPVDTDAEGGARPRKL